MISSSMAATIMPNTILPRKRDLYISFQNKISISCHASSTSISTDHSSIARRTGNFKPSAWGSDYIQSLNSEYSGEIYPVQARLLKEQVRMMLESAGETVDQLELIDDLQRIGVSYHFEDEIKQILTRIYEQKYMNKDRPPTEGSLYIEALQFRLLRQHGFKVPQGIFDCFKNENGGFKTGVKVDTKGLLELYEASHMSTEGENILELAREFSTICLQKVADNQPDHGTDQYLSLMVSSALDLPFRWRAERPYARWFMLAYERRPDKNDSVLEFAKLDFNMVQATYQEELKHVSRWWKATGLAERMPFARDSVLESYVWTIGGFMEPQHGYARITCAKVITLITLIDDVYDVYGTLQELQLFTDVIQRWDIEKIDKLPEYMQICFLALNNFVNDMAYDVLKTRGFPIIPHLRKSWADLCTAYLREAKWYFGGHTPRFEEYINNAWISVAMPAVLCHALFTTANANPLVEEDVQCLDQDIVRSTSIIIRLADDLGTSLEEMERGDVPKTIQCYMNETGAGEQEADAYVRFLTRETWKKINAEQDVKVQFPRGFVTSAIGLAKMAQYIYQHGGGYTTQHPLKKDHNHILSLLFENIA